MKGQSDQNGGGTVILEDNGRSWHGVRKIHFSQGLMRKVSIAVIRQLSWFERLRRLVA